MTYTEHRTPNRSFRIFDCYDTEAQVGDYIAVPGYAILKVLGSVDSGDYINLIVQEGSNKPYQIDLLKPEIELAEQERNRIEADETEMSAIIHSTVTEEFELYLANNYDSLTEPISSSPDARFSKFIEPSDKEIAGYPVAANGYHNADWTADGCEF